MRELRKQRPHALAEPTDSEIESIDLFVLRFLKLVDASTRRLFPAVLDHLGEYDEGMPLIDVLNRLEKLGWIVSARNWRLARERRNQLTHDYPDAPEVRSAILSSALDLAQKIQTDGKQVLQKLRQ